jgi:hypothetical protein
MLALSCAGPTKLATATTTIADDGGVIGGYQAFYVLEASDNDRECAGKSHSSQWFRTCMVAKKSPRTDDLSIISVVWCATGQFA